MHLRWRLWNVYEKKQKNMYVWQNRTQKKQVFYTKNKQRQEHEIMSRVGFIEPDHVLRILIE